MQLKKIQNANLENKKILMRVDINVELDEKKNIKEKFKISSFWQTLDYIFSQEGVKVALISHLGRPAGKKDSELSLKNIIDDLERIFNYKFKFISECSGEKVEKALEEISEKEVLVLENIRFHPEEKKNDADFSQKLAENFDIYINEAFSVSHRNQASVTGIAKYLPSYAGIHLQQEVETLEKIKKDPDHPAVAIIGGAKIQTKLPLIKKFEEKYDYILVAGKVANEAIDEKISFSDKVILPIDFAKDRWDIGEKTIEKFSQIISQAKTVVWNGPLGKFEEPPYDQGTQEIVKSILASSAFSVTGGGESVQFLEKVDLLEKFSFVSTGGGAMLAFMSDEPMPGLEVLMD